MSGTVAVLHPPAPTSASFSHRLSGLFAYRAAFEPEVTRDVVAKPLGWEEKSVFINIIFHMFCGVTLQKLHKVKQLNKTVI